MNYEQITTDLVKKFGSIRRASKECDISKTTFFELYKGKTVNPHINTHFKLINTWEKSREK